GGVRDPKVRVEFGEHLGGERVSPLRLVERDPGRIAADLVPRRHRGDSITSGARRTHQTFTFDDPGRDATARASPPTTPHRLRLHTARPPIRPARPPARRGVLPQAASTAYWRRST